MEGQAGSVFMLLLFVAFVTISLAKGIAYEAQGRAIDQTAILDGIKHQHKTFTISLKLLEMF